MSLSSFVIKFFIIKWILKTTDLECMIMKNISIYPCDECGFRAGDVKESLEHRESHREVGDERRTLRSISSHMSYVIEDEDLLVKDNSDLDEDWDLNQRQSVERILQEEDEDDEEFFFLQLQTM